VIRTPPGKYFAKNLDEREQKKENLGVGLLILEAGPHNVIQVGLKLVLWVQAGFKFVILLLRPPKS
jgi:hypothetical protein